MKPFQYYLSKMDPYEVEIQEGEHEKANVIVVDNSAMVDTKIAELRASLKMPIVGFDFKFSYESYKKHEAVCVVLSGGDRCLIIQLCRIVSFPVGLIDFLADETICFVQYESNNLSRRFPGIMLTQLISCMRRIIGVSDLTARVLSKPSLRTYKLQELCEEVGLILPSKYVPRFTSWTWTDTVFNSVQIECGIEEAHKCYKIGEKLLSILDS